MASSINELGYEDDRFANDISQNFHCPICLNVLKDPVMCRRNQHHFCTGCISRHLENSKTCPTCKEELTLETLSQPQRIYTSYLSELKIRCDYFNRGCPEFVELGNLKIHLENCGFSPVVCSNEGCNMEISKRDIVHHETEVCELRKIKCHECVETRKEIDDVKASLTEVNVNQIEMKASFTEMKASFTEMKANLAEVKANQTEMKASQTEMKASLTETRENLSDMNDKIRLQIRCMQDEIVNKVEAMMAGIKPAMAAERGVKEAVQQPSQDSTTDSDTRGNIIIAGGYGSNGMLNSVEMFRWSRKEWVSLKPMRTQRQELSSFIYKNQMIVAGGATHGCTVNTLEATNINQEPGQWLDIPARLPAKLCGHKNVVYKDRLLVIGGFDGDASSDAIYEVHLVPPYTTKMLYRMPNPRVYHGVELHDDNIFIAGGTTTGLDKDCIASIAKYDLVKNEYREVAELPFAVNEMATVSWKSCMLVLGGANEKGEAVNTVVLYDIEKEECHTLPSMKHKRKGCTAVVSGDLILVMGGRNVEEGHLNSVECFDFARYSWEELPAMLEDRCWATVCCC